jgi:poly(3-hydroxybutyrate) depolymerase
MCTGVPAGHKKHFEAMGAGHYGIFSGRRWREAVYPAVTAFILEANKALKKPLNKPVAQITRARAAPKKLALVKSAAKTVAKRAPVKAARSR